MRLTNYHREKIEKALIEHAFTTREKELRKQFAAWADEAYATVIGPHLKAMEKMPAWFFDKHTEFYVKNRNRPSGAPDLCTSRQRLFPHGMRGSYLTFDLSEFKDLDKRLHALDRDWGQMEEEKKTRCHEIRSALLAFKTVKDLVEGWPEIREAVPSELLSTTLPPMVVDVRRLTVSLGLGQTARAN